MSPQEMQLLENFLNQLSQARVESKDAQADAMISAAVARQPDAAYLLVQRALMLDQALANARAQISALQNELQAARSSTASGSASGSFLDSANAWGHGATARPTTQPAYAPSAPAPAPSAPSAQAAVGSRPGFLGGFGSTLGNIATTAAGVAGGALLFQGIENLFHHNSGSSFFSQPAMGPMPSETIVNNFYESVAPSANDLAPSSDSDFLDADFDGSDYSGDDTSYV